MGNKKIASKRNIIFTQDTDRQLDKRTLDLNFKYLSFQLYDTLGLKIMYRSGYVIQKYNS